MKRLKILSTFITAIVFIVTIVPFSFRLTAVAESSYKKTLNGINYTVNPEKGYAIINSSNSIVSYFNSSDIWSVDGYPVRTIGSKGFFLNTAISGDIKIPEQIILISGGLLGGAFNGCTGIKSVSIPEGTAKIGQNAFCACSSLEAVYIYNSECEIYDADKIGYGKTFCNGTDSNNKIYYNGIIYGYKRSTAQAYAEKYGYNFADIETHEIIVTSVPSTSTTTTSRTTTSTTTTSKNTTAKTTSTSSTLKTTTTSTTTTTTSTTHPSAYIANGTCGNNVNWTLDNNGLLIISGKGDMSNYTINPPWSSNRNKIKKVEIQYGVTSIGSDAFWLCSNLTSISIPDSITSIGSYAFKGCDNLTSIIIPDSVTNIKDCSFSGIGGLTSITIPNSVNKIGNYAFSDCRSLSSIIIPNSVTSIGENAFSDCTSLSSITISDSVMSIGKKAFSGCSNLSSIIIPNSVTSIGENAFSDCTSLSSITLSNSLKRIENGTFIGCSNLYSLFIPDSVTSIGNDVFKNCSYLTSVHILGSVTSIGDNIFTRFSGLYIHGEKGSYAESYANTNNIPFLYYNEISGDVNCDYEVSIADIVALQNFLLGRKRVNMNNWKNADLCKDNRLDVFDMVLMRRMLIEKTS